MTLDKINYKIKVIDNFLNKDDFEKISNLNIDVNVNKGIKVYHNEIIGKKILKSSIDNNLLIELNKYHNKAINILKELCPEKVSLYDYSDFTIIVTNKNAKFPYHDDTPNKLLSGVIYIKPENNIGTIFSNDKKGNEKEAVEWKQNRAVFFSRRERETWHTYQGDGINNRIALVYNLNTHRIKDIYKVENKNYFFGNLRYKINPHIYKYLKFTL
tara:strand:+ start:160 stop:801 length:642 start_codon:yes stop_codon:yes gene_type:complete